MNMMEWVICPICQNKTRLKIREGDRFKFCVNVKN